MAIVETANINLDKLSQNAVQSLRVIRETTDNFTSADRASTRRENVFHLFSNDL